MRFKTEQEFIKEFGINWGYIIEYCWNSKGKMDYLFGMPIPDAEAEQLFSLGKDGWHISKVMVTDAELTPLDKYYLGVPMRFKTEQEFINQYGKDWMYKIDGKWNFSGRMDYLFGTPLTSEERQEILTNGRFMRSSKDGTWIITLDMVIEGKTLPPPGGCCLVVPMRFKTEQEFIKEFGPEWHSCMKFSWNREGRMDYLFGTFLTEEEKKAIQEHGEFHTKWHISKDMITEEPLPSVCDTKCISTYSEHRVLSDALFEDDFHIELNTKN